MITILLIVLLIILLGGGGGYYAHGRYGAPGVGGVLGLVLIVLIVPWLVARCQPQSVRLISKGMRLVAGARSSSPRRRG